MSPRSGHFRYVQTETVPTVVTWHSVQWRTLVKHRRVMFRRVVRQARRRYWIKAQESRNSVKFVPSFLSSQFAHRPYGRQRDRSTCTWLKSKEEDVRLAQLPI